MMTKKGQFLRLLLRVTVLLFLIRVIHSDEYVKDLRKKCTTSRRPFYCVTFRIAKFVEQFDYDGPTYSAVKIVKIKQELQNARELLPSPRFINTDSEWDKFVKFLQRKLVSFLVSHGIAFEVPQGIKVVQGRSLNDVDSEFEDKLDGKILSKDEGRGHKIKEKKIFILSIIILAKLIKILLLVNMIFFVLLFIKKIILVTSIVFPSVLSHIKQACLQHQNHPTVIEKETPVHSDSWFGWRQDNVDRNHWSY